MSIATRFVASWGNRRSPAMSFDGNDYLSNVTADFRSADSQGAIEVWFRSPSTANIQTLVSSSNTTDTSHYLQIRVNSTTGVIAIAHENANGLRYLTGSTNLCDGYFKHIVISSNGTAYSVFINGQAESLEVSSGTNNGDWWANATGRDNINIGALIHTSATNFAIGEIGYTRIYSRPMLQPEAAANFVRGRNAPALNGVGLVFDLPMSEGTGEPTDKVGGLILPRTGATWTITTARN